MSTARPPATGLDGARPSPAARAPAPDGRAPSRRVAGGRRLAALLCALWPAWAGAQGVTLGTATETTSIDPHFADLAPNQAVRQHVFDSLVHIGPDSRPRPGLAVEWRRGDDPLVWEFRLRRGVRFHDGTPFTARDAAFSIARAPAVPNAPATVSRRVSEVAAVEIVDDFTLRIRTKTPAPLLPVNIAYLGIASMRVGMDAASADFNNGTHAIGTGPYRFVSWRPGDAVELVANPDYWGEKPRWSRVTIRAITNARSRVAALLAGDVDLIADVPSTDLPRLRAEGRFTVAETVSNRIMFWQPDVFREQALHLTGPDGRPIANPLRDRRVRLAMSLAIDRQAIVERVMEGLAVPAFQIVPAGFGGHATDLVPPRPDLERARRLMAEAGVAGGFQITIHTTNDRYVNDAKTAQAVAQMLGRIGIKVAVTALPVAVYYGPARKNEFTLPQIGWGNLTGDAEQVMREALKTGSINNYGRWSNAEFDRLLEQAAHELDLARRDELLRAAMRIAMEDAAIIPTHWQVNVWASRKGLRYVPRVDEMTLAMDVVPD